MVSFAMMLPTIDVYNIKLKLVSTSKTGIVTLESMYYFTFVHYSFVKFRTPIREQKASLE